MELAPVAALVDSRRIPPESFKPAKSDREITFRAVKAITAGVFLFFLGAIVSLAGRRVFLREDITTAGVFLLFFGLILIVFAFFQGLWGKTMPQPTGRTEATTQPDLNPLAARALPATIPSVTESTTRIIEEDSKDSCDRQPS